MRHACHSLLQIALIIISTSACQAQGTDETLQADGVDLIYTKMLQYHPAPFNRYSREDIQAAYEDLRSRADQLDEAELFIELSRFTGMVSDGHTYVWLDDESNTFSRSVSLRFWRFSDGVYVRAAAPEYTELVGAEVTEIGGVPIDEAWDRLIGSRPGENASSASRAAAVFMQIPEWLYVLDLSDSSETALYTVLTQNGEEINIELAAQDWDSLSEIWETSLGLNTPEGWVTSPSASSSLWLSRRETGFWKTVLEDGETLYVQVNQSQRSLDPQDRSRDDWGPFIDSIREDLRGARIQRLIIDLRHNRGGDTSMQQRIVHAVISDPEINRPGHVFVIAGRMTESASAAMVARFENETWALVAGEAPSSRPNFYNDPRPWYYRDVWHVPGTAINFRVARIVETWTGPGDSRAYSRPDIAPDFTYDDYAVGHDPVLDAVLALPTETAERFFHDNDGAFLDEPWLHIYRESQDPAWPEDPYAHLSEDLRVDRRQ